MGAADSLIEVARVVSRGGHGEEEISAIARGAEVVGPGPKSPKWGALAMYRSANASYYSMLNTMVHHSPPPCNQTIVMETSPWVTAVATAREIPPLRKVIKKIIAVLMT